MAEEKEELIQLNYCYNPFCKWYGQPQKKCSVFKIKAIFKNGNEKCFLLLSKLKGHNNNNNNIIKNDMNLLQNNKLCVKIILSIN